MARLTSAIAVVVLLIASAAAFYLPGTSPHEYRDGENVEVQVNVLSSVNTHLPFDYYSLPSCYPTKKFRGEPENLGEILMGDRIKPSPYENINVGEEYACQPLCPARQIDEKAGKLLEKRIREDYQVNLLMDNLPLAVVHPETGTFSVGVPLGAVEGGAAYLYNHMHFTIKYYELSTEEVKQHLAILAKKALKDKGIKLPETQSQAPVHKDYDDEDDVVAIRRIIAFVARPMSVKHDPVNPSATCNTQNFTYKNLPPQKPTDGAVVWSYGVNWERVEERWSTRWDVYLNVADHEIHWFNIINSTLIVMFLSALLAVIFLRALRRDITNYNRLDIDPEDLQEETGWKLVHKDVFRPPPFAWLLSALAGTGMQLLGMSFMVLVIAVLGFLSPANRGALFTALLVCFAFLGMYAGYTSARLLKMWGTPSWRYIFVTATVVPGVGFSVFFIINLAVWSQGSSAAVPFPTMVALIAMWFLISLPLVFVGAVVGYKRETIKVPVATNQIPRHIPPAPWHMNPNLTITIGGILPFGAVFIEVFFILTAVWLNRYYYVFGFLMLVFIILSITCAEITVVMCYFQLCAEDYRWWWRSFLTSGSCGGYLFVYAIFYFFTSTLRMTSFIPVMLYFGYMAVVSFVFFVMTGTIGFIACFYFVKFIYGSIKVD